MPTTTSASSAADDAMALAPAGSGADTLSIDDARRLAITAQGLGRQRSGRVTPAHLTDAIRRLGLLQLDFVNVVVPSHYLVMFARLGAYERRLLNEVVYRSGAFTEQWAHEASVVPMETWPLLRHRRDTHIARPWGFGEIMRKHRAYVDVAITEITSRGPLSPADLPDPSHTGRRLPGSWYGTVPRAVLEACFGRGQLAVTDRKENFQRVFDLAERHVPPAHFSRRVERHEAERELLRISAKALGVGTAADLADYFRMKVGDARPRIAELAEAGDLMGVRVDGWRETAYLPRGSVVPEPCRTPALLSPFDPLIWFRPRTKRLFAFDYRFEIFLPQEKRRWGSYVLPFLHAGCLAARVDVKAMREAGCLSVPGAWIEDGASAEDVATALAAELHRLAAWLGLGQVRVGRRGNLARALARAAAGPRATGTPANLGAS
jgi:uncharacterized protein